YARSLARDIGVALGTVAHLEELRRTRNGAFSISHATALADILAALDSGAPILRLIGLRDALLPPGGPLFKVVSESGELIAVARATSRVTAIVERIFNPEGTGA